MAVEGSDCGQLRNVCILAHVDHGKTTLADHLIASYGGGILHPKQAGKLRFMDFLDEEQRRAITMKSSSVCLEYKNYLVNLIDSPGHMDFCGEVSTAARLSDGALILVDAVEGVHIQTHAVLRQSWIEKLTPCLVLNKIDRLITELKLTPLEAYNRLSRIVHEVNGIMSAYRSEKYLSDVDSILAARTEKLLEEEQEEADTFRPQKGNVAFASSLEGWGFTVDKFAEFYASKLGASETALRKALWGPRYYNPKMKMIVGKKMMMSSNGKANPKPMFVQFVLEPLWKVYSTAASSPDVAMLEKVIKSFSLTVPSRELQQNKDSSNSKAVLQAVMSRWLPLSDAMLSMVVNCMPSPAAAQSHRISRLVPERTVSFSPAAEVRNSIAACDSGPGAPSVAFVSKMFSVPAKVLPDPDDDDEHECFLAFARVFSGVLRSGQSVFVLSALYDPTPSSSSSSERHIQEVELGSLYVMMGQELRPVSSAKAGSVVAIKGLGQNILKSATLSSTSDSWPFASMSFQVAPTLRVAIEPLDPAEMPALMKGLRLLNRADPFVEVSVSLRGEHVIAAAGEVHLERCVKDLRERFARVGLAVSPPIVSYKETIEGGGLGDRVVKTTAKGRCAVRARAVKLPALLVKVLEENLELFADDDNHNPVELMIEASLGKEEESSRAAEALETVRRMWNHIGTNILFAMGDGEPDGLGSGIVSGFQLAATAGPLCDEPMWGLGFFVEVSLEEGGLVSSGQVIAAVKDACRSAVLQSKPRLVEAMYFCELVTPTEYLGSVYAVLGKRRARVVKEEMQEGSPLFTVHAYLPVAESFGFADELRRWTSGAVSPLLVFSHWEQLEEDPFFIPKTEEELEEFGDGSNVLPNTARKLIDAVRRRKGLPVEEKIVQHATRQRTLARKV